MPEDTMNLNDSVRAAVAEHVVEEPVAEPKVETPAEEPKVENKEETPARLAPELSPEEVEKQRNAITLYDALLDPEKRKGVVEYLAKEVGLDPGRPQDVRQVQRSTVEFLKEKLGPVYSDMADALGPAFDELIAAKVKEQTKPLEDEIRASAQQAAQQQANSAMDSFYKRNNIPESSRAGLEAKLMKKMQQMPAAGDVTIEQYLDDIYYLVNRSATETKVVKETVEKINRNAKGAQRTPGTEINEDNIKKGSRIPTLKEAVEAAFRGERLE
jgi:hypothetical protein